YYLAGADVYAQGSPEARLLSMQFIELANLFLVVQDLSHIVCVFANDRIHPIHSYAEFCITLRLTRMALISGGASHSASRVARPSGPIVLSIGCWMPFSAFVLNGHPN